MSEPGLPREIIALLDRWVESVEAKDLRNLGGIFRQRPDLLVVWSNGERNVGWDEVRDHIDQDFSKDLALRMEVDDARFTPLGESAGALSFRYRIRVGAAGEVLLFNRLASMSLLREEEGWRIAALHVSTAPADAMMPA